MALIFCPLWEHFAAWKISGYSEKFIGDCKSAATHWR